MPRHRILLIIMNRRSARDPEGETLAYELRLHGYRSVSSIRAGKSYLLEVDAPSMEKAIELVKDLASKTRLYNPVVHESMVIPLAEGSSAEISGD